MYHNAVFVIFGKNAIFDIINGVDLEETDEFIKFGNRQKF